MTKKKQIPLQVLNAEIKSFSGEFSSGLDEAATLDKIAMFGDEQFRGAIATEQVFYLLLYKRAAQLKQEGLSVNKIARTLLPVRHSQWREHTINLVRDALAS